MRLLFLTIRVEVVVAELATLRYDPNSISWVADIWCLLCLTGIAVLSTVGLFDDVRSITFNVKADEVRRTEAETLRYSCCRNHTREKPREARIPLDFCLVSESCVVDRHHRGPVLGSMAHAGLETTYGLPPLSRMPSLQRACTPDLPTATRSDGRLASAGGPYFGASPGPLFSAFHRSSKIGAPF